MQKRWTNRNIDLALLTTRIGEFFKEKDFEAIKGETPAGYQILAENSTHIKLEGYISLLVEGKPNDFNVKLELCKGEKKSSFAPLLLTTMFLGGYFLSKRLKAEENWINFKKEFWTHLDNIVMNLSNSGYSTSSPK